MSDIQGIVCTNILGDYCCKANLSVSVSCSFFFFFFFHLQSTFCNLQRTYLWIWYKRCNSWEIYFLHHPLRCYNSWKIQCSFFLLLLLDSFPSVSCVGFTVLHLLCTGALRDTWPERPLRAERASTRSAPAGRVDTEHAWPTRRPATHATAARATEGGTVRWRSPCSTARTAAASASAPCLPSASVSWPF